MDELVEKTLDMGDLNTKMERKIEKHNEFAIYELRGLRKSKVSTRVGVFGDNLDESTPKQSSSLREMLFRKGLRGAPLPNLRNFHLVVSAGERARAGRTMLRWYLRTSPIGVEKEWSHPGFLPKRTKRRRRENVR